MVMRPVHLESAAAPQKGGDKVKMGEMGMALNPKRGGERKS